MQVFVLLILLLGCAHKPEKKNLPAAGPVRVSQRDIETCQEYQKTVLDKAYRILEKKESQVAVFAEDERIARGLLASFDFRKGLIHHREKLITNILSNCDEELIKKFDQNYKLLNNCSIIFSELNYFQALAGALTSYRWPTDLKLEAKKLSLDYVENFTQGDYPLLNRLIALSVLDELSVNQIVNKDLHPEIKQLMQDSHQFVEGLRSRLSKDPVLTCEGLDIIRDELKYSSLVAEKLKGLLQRI